MLIDLTAVLFIAVVVGYVLLFYVLPRWGPHYTSRLTCPHCRKVFNFHWVPGATITSIIQRGSRNLKCPYCQVKATYDIMSTRVAKAKTAKKQKPRA